MAGPSLREAQESDVDGIARLSFAEDPGKTHDLPAFRRLWTWLHRDNPQPQGKVLVGVDPVSGDVAGHYAIVPFEFRRAGVERYAVGGFLCRLLVAESSRNTMLFPQLEMAMLRGYSGWGMDFAYGLINRPLVLKAHLYFKFREVLALPVFARPVRLQKVLDRAVKNRWLRAPLRIGAPVGNIILRLLRRPSARGVEIAPVESFPDQMRDALDRLARGLPFAATRSIQTLNWRFAQLRDRGYTIFLARVDNQPRGYLVTRLMPMKELTALAIVDILFDPGDPATGNALLNRALDEAIRARADVCACLLNPLGPYAAFFRKRGFFKTPEAFTLIVHEPSAGEQRLAQISPADWHLTWFDHDYV